MNPGMVNSINSYFKRSVDLWWGEEGIDILSDFLSWLLCLPKLLNIQFNINQRSA